MQDRTELWVSDGTIDGTHLFLGAENPLHLAAIRSVSSAGSLAYFTAESIRGSSQLYVTDGTFAGTHQLIGAGIDLSSGIIGATGSHVFVKKDDGSLWASSGDLAHTAKIMNSGGYSFPKVEAPIGISYLVVGESTTTKSAIWVTDGTRNGTHLIMEHTYAQLRDVEADHLVVTFMEDSKFYVAELDLSGNILHQAVMPGGQYELAEIGGKVIGSINSDNLLGGAGDDEIFGLGNGDVIRAGGGDDFLAGGMGNDALFGAQGDDSLNGSNGMDILAGGAGTDKLTGGAGADVFVFASSQDSRSGKGSRDTIIDFMVGVDKIDLHAIDADALALEYQSFNFIGSAAFSGQAGELRFAKGIISADLDGDRGADFQISLLHVTTLQATDFLQ